jgi:hypothetical protein
MSSYEHILHEQNILHNKNDDMLILDILHPSSHQVRHI